MECALTPTYSLSPLSPDAQGEGGRGDEGIPPTRPNYLSLIAIK